jgi:dUTP pyrophosphatase
MKNITVQIQRLPHGAGIELPAYQTVGAAGMDLRAAVDEPLVIPPGSRFAVPTGLKVAAPPGFELQVRPRSGLALKHGIIVPNSPGTIDSDYRGEVKVILMNLGTEDFVIRRGDRIAQLVLARVEAVAWEETAELPETARSEGGFGHTGQG